MLTKSQIQHGGLMALMLIQLIMLGGLYLKQETPFSTATVRKADKAERASASLGEAKHQKLAVIQF